MTHIFWPQTFFEPYLSDYINTEGCLISYKSMTTHSLQPPILQVNFKTLTKISQLSIHLKKIKFDKTGINYQ